NCKANQLFDALFCVLKKSDYVESRRGDSQLPTEIDHPPHVLVWNEAARHSAQHEWIGRFDSEVYGAQPGGMHRSNQLLIKIVHPSFAFVSQLQAPPLNAFGNAQASFAIERVQRIANHDVQTIVMRA